MKINLNGDRNIDSVLVLGGSYDNLQYLGVLGNNVACDSLSYFDYVPNRKVVEFDCRGMQAA